MFSEIIRHTVGINADRTAAVLGDDSLTYAQMYERSCRLANLLRDRGVLRGEAVASLGRNQLGSLEELGAIAVGGFIRSPLYLQDTAARQVFMMQRVRASALIVDSQCWPSVAAELGPEGLRHLKTVLVRGETGLLQAPATGYDDALASSSASDPHDERDPDETYIIRFSAGTTGMPKPIAHSQRAYCLANEEVLSSTAPLQSDDVYLAVSPYSHASGNLVWPFVRAGASHALMTGGFDPDVALALIQQYRCTTLFLVPTMIQRLMSSPKCATTDLSSIRRIVYGAAPIPQDLISKALVTFGDVLSQSYGQSEIVPITCLTPSDHRAVMVGNSARLSSAGRATKNSAVRIEDTNGKILAPGEIGQIVGRSPGAMQGIYGDAAATAERMTPDGWVRTGDLGRLDEDGFLFVVDRMDDMIISGGFNIAPSEIEDALNLHGDVIEAVVFGVPHPEWGNVPIAVVRLKAGSTVSIVELSDWCRVKVGTVKKPSKILLTDEPLPVNAAGKLMRRVARETYAAHC